MPLRPKRMVARRRSENPRTARKQTALTGKTATAVVIGAGGIEARVEADATVVPTVIVTGTVPDATVAMTRGPPPREVRREATRVGAEAGAATMNADTHAVTEEATAISTGAGEGAATAPDPARLAAITVETIIAIVTTAVLTGAGTTTVTAVAAPPAVMPRPS